MWPAIIGGISGLLTGVIGAILAPWAKWRVDREQATEWRRERLMEWRSSWPRLSDCRTRYKIGTSCRRLGTPHSDNT